MEPRKNGLRNNGTLNNVVSKYGLRNYAPLTIYCANIDSTTMDHGEMDLATKYSATIDSQ